jgi:CRP/FNR family cyclic AMP-dependent transcriptional regulator
MGATAVSPYNLDIIDSCLTCKARESSLFCKLSGSALEKLDELKSVAIYPRGAVLFVEGQLCRGVFCLCQGHAKLLTSSREGKTIIMRIVQPGEFLGLSAAVSGRPYLATAEVIEPSQVNFFRTEDFLSFLREYDEAAYGAAVALSYDYREAFETIRTLGVSHSAPEKLARLILDWSSAGGRDPKNQKPNSIRVPFTHEEIAELIGASRETVTRLLNDFKRKEMISFNGSTLIILNRDALEALLGS